MTLLKDRYGHKVKTLAELLKIISPFPREKKVIMCHGVFDVVHPGHLRHLMYAKSRADILIASITADIHIAKGELRPHVPEDLRSINLAAFEMIDYVLIDPNSEPLDTIKELKPDYFAKGYEYSSQVQPKTQKEIETLSVGAYASISHNFLKSFTACDALPALPPTPKTNNLPLFSLKSLRL